MKLNVSSIQHFSTGDGPGIRTTVFLKGCNLHCPWCHNPETISKEPCVLHYPSGDVTNGCSMDIDDIIDEITEDIDFYADGGGATISGGEPMLQSEGVAMLARKLKEKGISVIIDTAGCVPYSYFENLSDYVNTFFIDLKASDEEGYEAVGGAFSLVIGNIAKLISDGRDVRVRIPLIPDFNDSDEYSERMCDALKSAGVTKVDLLPFHRLGSGKYEGLGLSYKYKNTEPMTVTHAKEVGKIYSKYFIVSVEK